MKRMALGLGLKRAAVPTLALCATLTLVTAPPASSLTARPGVPATTTAAHPFGPAADIGTAVAPAKAAVDVLPVTRSCTTSLRIRAQAMTAAQLSATCTSLTGQDGYFHRLVSDSGPVAGDRNTSLEVDVFNSRADYQYYAPSMFGVSTDNGGVYLEGNPAATGNQARFVAYRDDTKPAFEIKNLNHEYTHYLDGRFDLYGDYQANIATPTQWWIEGLAEYVGYGYRGVFNSQAATEAPRRTYALSTVFDNTPGNDQTRTYVWGYLAVWYMVENHPADVTKLLGYYRTGAWTAARTFLKQTIGTRYDTDWYRWLLT
ncbi:collagenase [Amycolatopsis sp. NBC_00348]|uniref:collagenase n=1 Tax=Amycolatopsis sp. NBC_00348 TaxID=2975956 RepID=UPI002E25CA1A